MVYSFNMTDCLLEAKITLEVRRQPEISTAGIKLQVLIDGNYRDSVPFLNYFVSDGHHNFFVFAQKAFSTVMNI